MGWTVLYIAFGIVALWLLGEVLLQYKARLRWRLLAFTGFLGVVGGVLIASRFVIAVGAIAFVIGQTYVTLSFRRGFSTGWAIGGAPGESRRRRGGKGRAGRRAEPVPEASGPEAPGTPDAATAPAEHGPGYDGRIPARPTAEPLTAVYEPEPLPDDTGQYGVYSNHQRAARDDGWDGHAQPQYGGYDAYPGSAEPAPGQAPFAGAYGSGAYDYGTGGQQQYAAYSDPYIGPAATGGPASYDYGSGYGAFGGGQQYPTADPYAQQYPDTPPGGVWVPQQREGEQYPMPPEQQPGQPAPYPNGYHHANGQDEERYRY